MFKKSMRAFFYSIFLGGVLLYPFALSAKTDFIKLEKDVVITEPVQGEARVMGETVIVEEEVSGDLLILGRDVTVNAPVGQDARIVAGHIAINSSVGGNVTAFGSDITFGKGSVIEGNVYSAGFFFDIGGKIQGDLTVKGDAVKITGSISGDVNLGEVSELEIGDDAFISGTLTYASARQFDVPKATVAGGIIFKGKEVASKPFWQNIDWFFQMVWFFAALLFGLPLAHIFSGPAEAIMVGMVKRPGKTILMGLVFSILVPLSAALLAVTLIGIPLGILLFLIMVLLVYVAPLFVAMIIGKLIIFAAARDKEKVAHISLVWFLIVGLILVRLLFILPGAGMIIRLLAICWGFGGMMMYARSLGVGKK